MWGNTIPVATKVLRTFRLYSKKIVSKIFALNKTTRPLLDLTAGLFVFQQSNVERDFMHIAEMAFNSGFPPYKFFVFNMKIFPKLSLWNFFIICHWVSVRSIVVNSNCNVVVEKADYLKTNKNIFGINNLDTKLSKPCSWLSHSLCRMNFCHALEMPFYAWICW